jgi:hypothetical protein
LPSINIERANHLPFSVTTIEAGAFMSHGRKPPIMPPRNPLAAAAAKLGKRPALPYRQALMVMRDRQRTAQQAGPKMRVVGSLASSEGRGIALPNDPRAAAKSSLTGALTVDEKAQKRTRRKIDKAQAQMRDEVRRTGFNGDAAAIMDPANHVVPLTAEEATNRPPRREAGRYDGLKSGEPG